MDRVNVENVRDIVAAIAATADDEEMAHVHEDRLYIAVLRHIAKGEDEHAKLAREALRAVDIEYDRWYA